MRKFSLMIAMTVVAFLANVASAQPPSFIDLGNIGNAGLITFDTVGSGFDTELGIWDADGFLLDADDDGGPGLESEITIDLADGTYFLGISEFNSIFEDGFLNTGTGFEAGESGTAILNIDGEFGGSILIGEVAGLDETGYFRVTVGVPEPASALILIGCAGSALVRRRR